MTNQRGRGPKSRISADAAGLRAFSRESLPRIWIAGRIPVRVKKTRQNKD
jgi:hypothetical protein